MLKYILLSIIVAVTTSLIAPRDLVDKAKTELLELRNIVLGETIAAYETLSGTIIDFDILGNATYRDGIISLQQEHDNIKTSINAIKNLAEQAHVDIALCTKNREDTIDRLPTEYDNAIRDCINTQNDEVKRIIKDAQRIVNLNTVKVDEIDQALADCNSEVLCIQPLLTQIELSKVRFPLNIKTELNAVQGVIGNLQIIVQGCSTDKNAEYNTIAHGLLDDITNCANNIIFS